MTLPNFLGIGAQRAATTWVHQCLSEHPDAFVSGTKELDFFTFQFDKGLAWYESQFAGHSGQKAVGETSPSYLHEEVAVRRIAETLPDVKMFAILREPIGRALSAYQLHPDQYEGMDFWQACRSKEHYLVGWSLYADALARFYEHFPREQVRVYLYDDIRESPSAMLADLFGFLGIDPEFRPPSANKLFNRSVFPEAQKTLRRLKLGWSVELIKKSPLAESIKKLHKSRERGQKDDVRSTCPEDLRARFRADIDRVEGLIGRDLSRWK